MGEEDTDDGSVGLVCASSLDYCYNYRNCRFCEVMQTSLENIHCPRSTGENASRQHLEYKQPFR